jgi:hypothetical protein
MSTTTSAEEILMEEFPHQPASRKRLKITGDYSGGSQDSNREMDDDLVDLLVDGMLPLMVSSVFSVQSPPVQFCFWEFLNYVSVSISK